MSDEREELVEELSGMTEGGGILTVSNEGARLLLAALSAPPDADTDLDRRVADRLSALSAPPDREPPDDSRTMHCRDCDTRYRGNEGGMCPACGAALHDIGPWLSLAPPETD